MLTLKVDSNIAKLKADIDADQKAIRRAAKQGINVAAKGLRTDASREIRSRYPKFKNRDLLDMFDVTYAGDAHLRAVVSVRGRPLTVGRFMTSAVTKRGKGGVWVNIKGARKFIRHAWVRTGTNKRGEEYTLVWNRVSNHARAPIEPVKTIDIPSVMNIKDLAKKLEDMVYERFTKEYGRQLQRSQVRAYIG